MLRIATEEDFELVHSMAMKFMNASPYKDYVDEEKMKSFVNDLIISDNNQKIVLLWEDLGGIGGIILPFLYGTKLVATEVAWWVEPEHRKTGIGKELIEAFEFWAKKAGCSLITMMSLDPGVEKYYEKRGYKLVEKAYMKEI